MKHALGIHASAALLLAACAGCTARPADPAPPTAAAPGDVGGFAEPGKGIAVRPVAGTHLAHDFKRSYLTLDAWKLYPAPGSAGTPLVAVVVDGSNEVTSAEMRIGRSTTAADITACRVPPAQASGAAAPAVVGGVAFAHFKTSDAAMSHYVSADSYRAVRDGACYAIDLIVAGTRPEVYDPPRTPPFSQAAADKALAAALAAVYWQR